MVPFPIYTNTWGRDSTSFHCLKNVTHQKVLLSLGELCLVSSSKFNHFCWSWENKGKKLPLCLFFSVFTEFLGSELTKKSISTEKIYGPTLLQLADAKERPRDPVQTAFRTRKQARILAVGYVHAHTMCQNVKLYWVWLDRVKSIFNLNPFRKLRCVLSKSNYRKSANNPPKNSKLWAY